MSSESADISPQELLQLRMRNLLLSSRKGTDAADVVRQLGALQAQDYASALWALGLRTPASAIGDIEEAVRTASILRTWPMRGTLHFIPAEDAAWMLPLLTPRVLRAMEQRQKNIGLCASDFERAARLFQKALGGGRRLTRSALVRLLEAEGLPSAAPCVYHLLCRLSQEGLLCFAPPEGREPVFALLDEWVPNGRQLARPAALAELARRYFRSHGPATLHDFAWWSGLVMKDCRHALAEAGDELVGVSSAGIRYWTQPQAPDNVPAPPAAQLLPAFDEHLLGYKERQAQISPEHARLVVPGGNGIFRPTILINGRVAGTWKARRTSTGCKVELAPFAPIPAKVRQSLHAAIAHYADFLGLPVETS